MSNGPPGASFWEEKYSEEDVFMYGKDPNDFLKQTIPNLSLPSGAKCLLLADGEGRNGVFLAELGHEVTSVDFSQAGLHKAEMLAQKKGVSLTTVLADLGDYDFGTEQWDCIVGIFCHLPPAVRAKVLEAIPISLKPGGVFVLECYSQDQPTKYKTGGPASSERCYSSSILSEALEKKLTIEQNEELVRDVVEGVLHTGTAAVVQFIGRK